MNQELIARLNGILDALESSVKTGADFAIDQAPDIVQQLLLWKFSESLIFFIFSICLSLILIILGYLSIKKGWGDKEGFSAPPPEIVCAFIQIIHIVPLLIISSVGLTWLKIWIAPKLYLIEYISSLIK